MTPALVKAVVVASALTFLLASCTGAGGDAQEEPAGPSPLETAAGAAGQGPVPGNGSALVAITESPPIDPDDEAALDSLAVQSREALMAPVDGACPSDNEYRTVAVYTVDADGWYLVNVDKTPQLQWFSAGTASCKATYRDPLTDLQEGDAVPGRLLVTVAAASDEECSRLVQGIEPTTAWRVLGVGSPEGTCVALATGLDQARTAAVTASPRVLDAGPDTVISASAVQDVPGLPTQGYGVQYAGHLDALGMPVPQPEGGASAFDGVYNYPDSAGEGVRVYVVDSGLNYRNPQFQTYERGWSTAGDEWKGARDTCSGHGSHVAGLVAGKDVGVAKKATVIPVRVNVQCHLQGGNNYQATTGSSVWEALASIRDDVASRVDATTGLYPWFVVNVSKKLNREGVPADLLNDLQAMGGIVVLSASNDFINPCKESRDPEDLLVGDSRVISVGALQGLPATYDVSRWLDDAGRFQATTREEEAAAEAVTSTDAQKTQEPAYRDFDSEWAEEAEDAGNYPLEWTNKSAPSPLLLAPYSNFGDCVDVWAPGAAYSASNFYGVIPDAPELRFMKGTSMASPIVAGVAALWLGEGRGLKSSPSAPLADSPRGERPANNVALFAAALAASSGPVMDYVPYTDSQRQGVRRLFDGLNDNDPWGRWPLAPVLNVDRLFGLPDTLPRGGTAVVVEPPEAWNRGDRFAYYQDDPRRVTLMAPPPGERWSCPETTRVELNLDGRRVQGQVAGCVIDPVENISVVLVYLNQDSGEMDPARATAMAAPLRTDEDLLATVHEDARLGNVQRILCVYRMASQDPASPDNGCTDERKGAIDLVVSRDGVPRGLLYVLQYGLAPTPDLSQEWRRAIDSVRTTTVTLQVTGCEGCTLKPRAVRQAAPGEQPFDLWEGTAVTVRGGVATFEVRTALTAGMSLEITAPWEKGSGMGAVPLVALSPGTPSELDPTYISGQHCYPGTQDSQVTIPIAVEHRSGDDLSGVGSTVWPHAWADYLPEPERTPGHQDLPYCLAQQ